MSKYSIGYKPSFGSVLVAPAVLGYKIAEKALVAAYHIGNWLDQNEKTIVKVVYQTLDSALGLAEAASYSVGEASSFAKGFVRQIAIRNGINPDADFDTRVEQWQQVVETWFAEKKEEAQQIQSTQANKQEYKVETQKKSGIVSFDPKTGEVK